MKLLVTLPLHAAPGLLLGAFSPLCIPARLTRATLHAEGVEGEATVAASAGPLARPLTLAAPEGGVEFELPDAPTLGERDGIRVAITTGDDAHEGAVAHLVLQATR